MKMIYKNTPGEFCQGVPWIYFQSPLNALGMDELPNCFKWPIQRQRKMQPWFWRLWHQRILGFGTLGCLNDKKVINLSPLFQLLLYGGGRISARQQCVQNNMLSYWRHLLPLGNINPIKVTFQITDFATQLFTTRQESVWKDIERTFAFLQGKFHILEKTAIPWYPKKISKNSEDMHHITKYDCWIKIQTKRLTSLFAIY